MCCCGKPVVNGELGYKWQPEDSVSVRPINAPDLEDDDVLLFDEPGRCGGLDHHSHHFRVVKHWSCLYLLVRHGGGQERIRLFPHRDLPRILEAMDSNARFWLLATIYDADRNGRTEASQAESAKWRAAAAEKRIKTRKQPSRGVVKVWIEPKQLEVQQ